MKHKMTIIAMALISTSAYANNFNNIDYSVKGTKLVTQSEITPYIIGGEDSDISKFPYYARLVATNFVDEANDFCGGSALNNKYILTAAHCVTVQGTNNKISDSSIASMGIITKSGSTEYVIYDDLHAVKDVIIHPDYNVSSFQNDIALVELKTPMEDSDFTAISLPTNADLAIYSDLNKIATVTGMGLGYIDDNKTSPTIIQQADLTNVSDSDCKTNVEKIYVGGVYNESKQSCALPRKNSNDKLTGVCNGDSGGPLTYLTDDGKYKQFALTSYGAASSCSQEDVPQVFTEILGYKDWIECYMDENNTTDCSNLSNPGEDKDHEGNFENGNGSGGSTGIFALLGLGLLGFRRKK